MSCGLKESLKKIVDRYFGPVFRSKLLQLIWLHNALTASRFPLYLPRFKTHCNSCSNSIPECNRASSMFQSGQCYFLCRLRFCSREHSSDLFHLSKTHFRQVCGLSICILTNSSHTFVKQWSPQLSSIKSTLAQTVTDGVV